MYMYARSLLGHTSPAARHGDDPHNNTAEKLRVNYSPRLNFPPSNAVYSRGGPYVDVGIVGGSGWIPSSSR